jgi:tRNA (guanine-N7-)-methyltransferase
MKDTENTPFVKIGRMRSFGRTSSRMSIAEQGKLEQRLTAYGVPVANQTTPEQLFDKEVSHLVVELGMGNGESIAIRSQNEPEKHFIGCEVYKNGLLSLVRTIEEKDIQNLKICSDDARELLEQLPKNSVDELVVLYPDPWPKNKQKKRRIINDELLNLADKVVKEDGTLFIATDIPDYMMWILREVYNHDIFFPTAISPDEWAKAPQWWYSTKYEQKAIKQGRKAWYMAFKRNVDKSNTKCKPLIKHAEE